MVRYIWLMEVVKAEVMVPRLMRTPPVITTGMQPMRVLSTVDSGAAGYNDICYCIDDVCV